MKLRIILPAALALAGACVLFAKVTTDYDRTADFGRYHTYSIIKVQAENQLWDDRISSAINTQLTNKGWQNVPSGGDAAVAAYGSTRTRREIETWYNGWGGGWGWRRGWGGPGIATTTVDRIPVGQLNVDIFDAQTKKLIWRGSSTDTLSDKPEKNINKLNKAVASMFKNFPPKSRG